MSEHFEKEPEPSSPTTVSENFETMLCQTLDVLQGPASRGVILQMLSTATDLPVSIIEDDVDIVIKNLLSAGRLTMQKGKYVLVEDK